MNQFVVFKRFDNIEQAEEIAEELKIHGIEYEISSNIESSNSTFAVNNEISSAIELMVKESEFEIANELLAANATSLLIEGDEPHYIHDFTIDELYEILKKPDEWSVFDYQIAQTILKEKGEEINEEILKNFKEERLKELSKPEKTKLSLIFAGYFFAIIGGFVGIVIGWYLFSTKKEIPNGERINAFSEDDIEQGKRIFKIGIVALFIWIVGTIAYLLLRD